MTWNYEENYVLFAQYSQYLKSSLGIVQLDYYMDRQELLPYFTQITNYINKKLILLGTEDIKEKVKEILRIFRYGADLICNQGATDLAYEVEMGIGDPEYDNDRFVFSWTNALTSLCMRLKFQYAYLFKPEINQTCCKCGATGETYADYESWYSGIYPEDEDYDRSNYNRTNTAWVAAPSGCECYRHASEED